MSIRLCWRKITWAIVLFNVLMGLLLLMTSTARPKQNCADFTISQCARVSQVARGTVAGIEIVLWVVGGLVLLLLWFATRERPQRLGQSLTQGYSALN